MRFPYVMAVAMLALALAGCGDDPNRLRLNGNLIAIDGDTFYVSGERGSYRLARIDAPEMPGHCRPGRRCAKGDPYVAKRALQHELDKADMVICERQKRDVYGRWIVECSGPQLNAPNISDELLAIGVVEEYRR